MTEHQKNGLLSVTEKVSETAGCDAVTDVTDFLEPIEKNEKFLRSDEPPMEDF